ncbi:MAG: hypothetical protein V4555_10490 [Acidobacteriota bacterium]
MANARVTLSPSSAIFAILSTFAMLTAAGLTLLARLTNDVSTAMVLFYPLFPGLIASLLITGGHGGTASEERTATIVAILVNALFYLLIVLTIRFFWRMCFRDKYSTTAPDTPLTTKN